MSGSAASAVTVARALALAAAQGLDRTDAHLLLAAVLQRPRSWLIAHDDVLLTADEHQRFDQLCQQRADGVPAAYLLSEREFHGLPLRLTPDVLVPRPDTETLVDWALDLMRSLATGPAHPQVLDLGTGSGAIALAIAHGCPKARVQASDVSEAALAVARSNAQRLGLAVDFCQGSWWQAVPAGMRFDLVLCNPPYIAAGDLHLPALRHEPMLALSPGGDGLDALREVIAGAPTRLNPGGWLLLEHGWDQADAVADLLCQAGLQQISLRHDLAGRARCSGACQPLVSTLADGNRSAF